MVPHERASLNLFRQAIDHHDAQAWEHVHQRWSGVLLHWLYQHPCARLALVHESPESSITAALSKF